MINAMKTLDNEKQNNQDYLKILLEDMSNKNTKANDIL